MASGKDRQERAARAEQMRREREKAQRRQRNLLAIGIVVVVVALIAFAAFAITRESEPQDVVAPQSVDGNSIAYTPEDAGGTANDPVTVTLYEDFQCPFCAQLEQQVAPELMTMVEAGDITMEYRPIAFLDRQSENEYASRALNASLCVLDEGGVSAWKKMHDLLYASQPAEGTAGPDDDALIATAKQAGVEGIDSCITDRAFGPWGERATDDATGADGFPGTPWVQVDGKTVDNPTLDEIRAAIKAAGA